VMSSFPSTWGGSYKRSPGASTKPPGQTEGLRPCVMYTLLADPPALRRPLWLISHKPKRPAGAGGFYRHLYTSYTNPGGIPQGARRYFVIQKLASGFQNGTALKASTRGSLCMKMRRGCCGTRRRARGSLPASHLLSGFWLKPGLEAKSPIQMDVAYKTPTHPHSLVIAVWFLLHSV